MNDLITLLDRAAGPTASTLSDATVSDDLQRGRAALACTRRRRTFTGLVGVAAAGLFVAGAAAQPWSGDAKPVLGSDGDRTSSSTLQTDPTDARPYSFDSVPTGWSVQGASPYAVTFAPDDGSTDPRPDVFEGKLVVMLDAHQPTGEPVVHDGRDYWVTTSSGVVRVSTRTRPGEPEGVVLAQFPADTGWAVATMLEFLDDVHVGEGARTEERSDVQYERVPGGFRITDGGAD